MRYPQKIIVGVIALTILTGAPLAALAQSDTAGEDKVRFAHETETQLLGMGCERVLITDKQSLASAQSLGWYAVIPVDATEDSVALCSPQVVQQLKPVEGSGEVKSMVVPATLAGGPLAGAAAWGAEALGAMAVSAGNEAATGSLDKLFEYLGSAGKKTVDLLGIGIPKFLVIHNFTSSDAVVRLWPLMLGIANLGFLLGLVVIALMVTLRLDAGGGVRRLLPRLLIGALLINFSLVIGGVIIDVSRLTMALVAVGLDMAALDESLFNSIYEGSGLEFISVHTACLVGDAAGWDIVLGNFLSMILAWLMAICLAIVLFAIVVRYFAIILLLIVSPFAYLALAFPNAQKISAAWWSNFLKYVFYGPIVVILLIMVSKASDIIPTSYFALGSEDCTQKAALGFLKIGVYSFGLIFAAMAGRYAGIAGSSMALNLVSRGGRGARSLAYRGAYRGAGLAARGAYVGTGTRRAVREGRAIAGKATEPIQRTMGLGKFSKFDEKGRLKKGKETVGGVGERLQRAAGYVTPGAGGRKQTEANRDARNMRTNIATPTAITHAALRNEEAGKALTSREASDMTAAVVGSGDRAKTINLLSNVEIVRKMDAAAQAAVMNTGETELIKALNASLRRVANET